MSRTETHGTRSIAWSIFHRSMPKPAYMIDMDYLECCQYCKQPLLIGELAQDVGQPFKPTTILLKLAQKANVAGILIFYDEKSILKIVQDITHESVLSKIPAFTNDELKYLWSLFIDIPTPILRVTQIYPNRLSEKLFTARQYFELLERLHQKHEVDCFVLKQKHSF